MNKFTKITATIGPSCDSEESIASLIGSGVNVFRFNFKHNAVEWHGERIQRVKNVAQDIGIHTGTLIDLQGPEIRIHLSDGELAVAEGEIIFLGTEFRKDGKSITIPQKEIIKSLEKGQDVFIDDGAFTFTVEDTLGEEVTLRCHSNGVIKERKSMNIPGLNVPLPVLIERDYDGLDLVKQHGVNFIALSFVRTAEDIRFLRKEMEKRGITAQIVAKIEAQKALENLDEIIEETDIIMVARGDLGVEVPLEQVPYYQKVMIKKCLEHGVPVITATQMLQSMIEAPAPTRAEISDVANAVYDLTDSVMLSGETATGKYPLETVKIMARTAQFNEHTFPNDRRKFYDYIINDIGAMICNSAYSFSFQCFQNNEEIVGFLVFTQYGNTARLLSRYRPHIPIFAFTESPHVRDSLTLSYGVLPFCTDILRDHYITKDEITKTTKVLKEKSLIKTGDRLITVYGDARAEAGMTDTMRIIQVE